MLRATVWMLRATIWVLRATMWMLRATNVDAPAGGRKQGRVERRWCTVGLVTVRISPLSGVLWDWSPLGFRPSGYSLGPGVRCEHPLYY
eukprot:1194773-Prorocentrum_minimum.AAC.5